MTSSSRGLNQLGKVLDVVDSVYQFQKANSKQVSTSLINNLKRS